MSIGTDFCPHQQPGCIRAPGECNSLSHLASHGSPILPGVIPKGINPWVGRESSRWPDRPSVEPWDQPHKKCPQCDSEGGTEEVPQQKRVGDHRPPIVATEGAEPGWPEWPRARGLAGGQGRAVGGEETLRSPQPPESGCAHPRPASSLPRRPPGAL